MDNNMRADFFGPPGDPRWNQKRMEADFSDYEHHELR
jgi:CDP-paratose 2-epimerase